MALIGYEWLVLVAIVLVLLLWGPQKIPQLARSLGLARKEFQNATKEGSTSGGDVEDSLTVAARNVGISTEGKTKEELTKEIADRTSKK